MPHKIDRTRHRRDVRNAKRAIKARYMKLTANDTLTPDKALSVLKTTEAVASATNLARKLAARGVYVKLHSER